MVIIPNNPANTVLYMSHKGHRLNRIELQSLQDGLHKVQTTFIDERKCSILYGTANYPYSLWQLKDVMGTCDLRMLYLWRRLA